MKIEDLEIGKAYTRFDDSTYFILYKAKDWFVCIDYSSNHHVGTLEYCNQEWLNMECNQKLVQDTGSWVFDDELYNAEYIDWQTIKF